MVDAGAAPIDRYVVLEHLSEGGMGAIYVGKKLGAGGFEMQVVLKQLLPEFTQQEEFIDLFLREAKLSATLDHANIVHTIDLVSAGNEYFIVMEYLAGGDLRTLLKKAKRRGKRFSPAAAIFICREVLSALAYAHVKRDMEGTPLKLIHRDVSPSNILVSYSGEVKLTDFGIAKAATHNSLFYKVKGKIGYMSPEQAKSEPLDHRSDLYSLAVCLYEVLTGERLFVHAGLTTSAEEIYSQPVPAVSRKVPGLTPDLDAVMGKALALSPTDRYQTAGEFQEALTRCAHRNGLLISAPEVARELLDACGTPDQWRGEDEDEDVAVSRRAGTEVYDIGDDEDEDDAPEPSIHGIPMRKPAAAAAAAPSRGVSPELAGRTSSSKLAVRPKTEIHKLGGVMELTSIINMIDLEAQHRAQLGLDAVSVVIPMTPTPGRSSAAMTSQALLPGSGPASGPASGLMMPGQASPSTLLGHHSPPSPGQMGHPGPPPPGYGGKPAIGPYPGQDPRDLLPTLPRRVPQTGTTGAQLPQYQAPDPGTAPSVKKRSVLRPVIVILAIVIAAAVAAGAVAISGPDVAVQHGK